MAGIFISYRRDDAQGEARHLFDNLKEHFGADRVFMDVIAIRPGEDYRKVIDSAVASCDVLIALIGKEWLQSTTAAGQPRLSDARDFVRLETAAALKRDVRVIPVLVQGATMPTEAALPDDLKPLAFRNAIELSHSRWDYDVRVLIEALERVLTPTGSAPGAVPAAAGSPSARRPIRYAAAAGAVAALLIGGAGYWFWPRTGPTVSAPSPEPPKPSDPSKVVTAPKEPEPAPPPKPAPPRATPPSGPKSSIRVPELIGLKEADAAAAIKRAGLALGKRTSIKRGDVNPGMVVGQAPAPGESVEEGGRVSINVAVPDLRPVPNLIGQSQGDASWALKREDLKAAWGPETTDEVKAGTVARQRPPPGTQVAPGTRVEVFVAVPATIEVPKLTGMLKRDAVSALENVALGYRVSERPADRERPDLVIGQDPPAGTRLKSDGVVELQVAVAADLRTVVDVVGKTDREAFDLLRKADLKPVGVKERSDDHKPGIVLRQDPKAGTRLSPGTQVTLTVATTATVLMPNVTNLPRDEATYRLTAANLNWKVEAVPNRQSKPGIVLAQSLEPGVRIRPKAVVELKVAALPETASPRSCLGGYVWRQAFPGDYLCVSNQARAQAVADNREAPVRRERDESKRSHGPTTCASGYVWRAADAGDRVCVTPDVRAQAAEDNRQGASRTAR